MQIPATTSPIELYSCEAPPVAMLGEAGAAVGWDPVDPVELEDAVAVTTTGAPETVLVWTMSEGRMEVRVWTPTAP